MKKLLIIGFLALSLPCLAQSSCNYLDILDYVNISNGDVLEFAANGVYLNDTLVARDYALNDCVIELYQGADTVLLFGSQSLQGMKYGTKYPQYNALPCLYDVRGRLWLGLRRKSARKK